MQAPQPIQDKLSYSKLQVEFVYFQITAYLNEKSEAVLREEYSNPSDLRSALTGKEIPSTLRLMCGDAIQNIRSTLDYLVWELVLANDELPDEKNAFPICMSPDIFKEAKKRRLRGVHCNAVAIIDSLQPYHFGQGKENESSVFVLDKLANIHKHRTILMVRERHTPIEGMAIFDSSGNLLGLDPSLSMDEDVAVRRIKSAIEMNVNAQVVVYIEFGEGPAKGLEVISVVTELYRNVAMEIIPRFNRFFL